MLTEFFNGLCVLLLLLPAAAWEVVVLDEADMVLLTEVDELAAAVS